MQDYPGMNISNGRANDAQMNAQIHEELSQGDWEALFKTSTRWLQDQPSQPAATFIRNIACLFINPPDIIQNKHYLESVGNKDWKAVLSWFQVFLKETDLQNPYFLAINFILQPASKKVESIESALQAHPNNAELLFLQAIALRDRNASVEKLKQALQNKPEFPACLYLLGIFSLQLNQVEAAEGYLKQAVEMSPDFLEAHYQLGSLYTLYIPNSSELSRQHFERVIEIDPEGGAAKDARKVLDGQSKPQYGQRIGSGPGAQRGGMSFFTILGISLLSVVIFSELATRVFKISNPSIGLLAGLFVFIGLYSAAGRRKG